MMIFFYFKVLTFLSAGVRRILHYVRYIRFLSDGVWRILFHIRHILERLRLEYPSFESFLVYFLSQRLLSEHIFYCNLIFPDKRRSPKGIVSIHCEIRIGTLENHLKSLFQISKISIRDDSLDPEELTGNDTTPWVVLDVVATRVTMSLSMYAFSLQNAKFWTVLGEEDLAKGWKRQHVWKNQ